MGVIIRSICKSCNFSNEFNFGGGRYNYSTNCPVPAINKETLEFENPNYVGHKNSNKYIWYTHKELKSKSSNNATINNFDLHLNESDNYCPNCKEMTLDFRVRMFVD